MMVTRIDHTLLIKQAWVEYESRFINVEMTPLLLGAFRQTFYAGAVYGAALVDSSIDAKELARSVISDD